MARSRSPVADRRALANALRQLREDAGLSLERAAADALDASAAKLSRIENGKQVASPRDVRDLCALYGVTDDRAAQLMEWATSAKKAGWWDDYGVNDDDYIGLESAAVAVHNFSATMVPGLLQTPAYARAYLDHTMRLERPTAPPWTGHEIDEWLEIRERRQTLIHASSGTRLTFIIDEAALVRPVGGGAMHEQLEHLIQVCGRENIVLHVLPFVAGAHAGQVGGSFSILTLPDNSPDVAYVESQTGPQLVEDHSQVERFRRLYETISAACTLSHDETLSLLRKIADALP